MKRSLRSLLERHELLLEGAEDDIIDQCVDDLYYVIENTIQVPKIIDSLESSLDTWKPGTGRDVFKLIKKLAKHTKNVSIDSIHNEVRSLSQKYLSDMIEKYVVKAREVCETFNIAKKPQFVEFIKRIIKLCSVISQEEIDEVMGTDNQSYYYLDYANEAKIYSMIWLQHISTIIRYGNRILNMPIELAEIANDWKLLSDSDVVKLLEQFSKFVDAIDKFLAKKRIELPKVPYESQDGKLDHYAFAEERSGDVPFEKDNEYEQNLWGNIANHLTVNQPISVEIAREIKQFLISHEYSTIFHAPSQPVVQRGMAVDQSYIMNVLGVSNLNDIETKGDKEANFTFRPKKDVGATSWTTDLNVAKKFCDDSFTNRNDVKLIIYARVEDNPNKFWDFDKFYNMQGLNMMDNIMLEDEVLGLGSIKAYKITWEIVESD